VKPYSESCDQNRDPILAVIEPLFARCSAVLEIGSGTGQHAVYFARRMPHLTWYSSDRQEYLGGIWEWLREAALPNAPDPLLLDAGQPRWPRIPVDAVFSANTAHIMHWPEVEAMFAGVGQLLPSGGLFVLYGPFNYQGTFTSGSNARFDAWLKARDPRSGIRDFEELNRLAGKAGMSLQQDHEMPANNRTLCWRKD
jgi:cyclopropane fatty-acyl-phospholipid synthase-like methyltransferase